MENRVHRWWCCEAFASAPGSWPRRDIQRPDPGKRIPVRPVQTSLPVPAFPCCHMAVGQPDAHFLQLPLTGQKIGIGFGLAPMAGIGPIFKIGQPPCGGFDLFDNDETIFFKNSVDSPADRQHQIFGFHLQKNRHLGPVAFRPPALNVAMDADAVQGSTRRGKAHVQIAAAQHRRHQRCDGNLMSFFLQRPFPFQTAWACHEGKRALLYGPNSSRSSR